MADGVLGLSDDLVQVVIRDLLSLPSKDFLEVFLRNKAFICGVKVVESEEQVGICKCYFLVDGGSQKLAVVDLACIVEVQLVKQLVNVVVVDVRDVVVVRESL